MSMNELEIDEYKLFKGRDIPLNKNITMTIPTLDQIEEFGERGYFSAIYNLCAVGADMKWQLWENGIDFTKIDDYELFVKFISQIVGSRKVIYQAYISNPDLFEQKFSDEELQDMLVNPLQLLLKDIDLADYKPYQLEDNQIVLYNPDKQITIDRYTYQRIVNLVRKIHGFKRNGEIPANEKTKMDMIEDSRDEFMAKQNKPYKSILLSLHSSLEVYCGLCGTNQIGNMPVSAFFHDIKRLTKIQDSQLLLQGAYSGFANLKDIDKSRLDMFGDI